MLRIGAHMSVAGGVSNAVERGVLHGCEALQIFTKNANRWQSAPLDPREVRRFRKRLEETDMRPAVSHASYLINLATTFPALREQSIASFIDEIDRAHALGLLGVVVHPGTCTAGTEADAFDQVASAIRTAFKQSPRRKTMVLLEHTAGQGRTIGYRFEHLAEIIGRAGGSERLGVCLDTCHLIASGYDIVSDAGYQSTFGDFERLVGLGRLKVFHGNDSKKPCRSRVDRHEHVGEGCLGLEPFRRLMHDGRFNGLPILIETAKSAISGRAGAVARDPLDMKNLDTLRRLAQERGRHA
jgi:deoxyribonuclease-4